MMFLGYFHFFFLEEGGQVDLQAKFRGEKREPREKTSWSWTAIKVGL